MEELEDAAMRGTAVAGVILAVRDHDVEVRVQERFARALPPRPPTGWFARWRQARPAVAPAEVRTFAISPPPMATDAFTHPVFVRLAGELPVRDAKVGDQVFVMQAMSVSLLRDDPPTRARLTAAFDRTADRDWSTAASGDELHLALLDYKRWDAALDELRHRKALDPSGLATLVSLDQLPRLGHVIKLMSDAERSAFLDGAARRLTDLGDRTTLGELARSLFDRLQLHQLQPLLLQLDAKHPAEHAALEFARVRLRMLLAEEPHRAAEFARLTAHLGDGHG